MWHRDGQSDPLTGLAYTLVSLSPASGGYNALVRGLSRRDEERDE